MKKHVLISTFALCLAVTTGCRTFTSPARSHALPNGVTWVDYDASRRGGFVVPEASKVRLLAEPPPDIALGVVSDFTGKVSYQGISAEMAAKVTESIAELGKRTQTVMVLREALFRLHEMQTYSNGLTATEIKDLYSEILRTTEQLATAEAETARAEADKAKAELARAETAKIVQQAQALKELNRLKEGEFLQEKGTTLEELFRALAVDPRVNQPREDLRKEPPAS